MHIKTTADIVNEVNWHGLNFYERAVLKTMIDLSFKTGLVQVSQINKILTSMNTGSVADCVNSLSKKGFTECHIIDFRIYYEVIPFTERVPCG